MSETTYNSRSGDFATSPRSKVADHYDFIRAKAAAGVPVSAIARMIGCNIQDVSSVAGLPVLDAKAKVKPVPVVQALKAIRIRADREHKPRMEQWREVRAARARTMPPRALAIVEDIAHRHGVRMVDLLGPRTLKGLSRVRDEVYHALYATGFYSMPQIGCFIGGRDHSSVLHGIRNHGERSQAEADIAAWKALGRQDAA